MKTTLLSYDRASRATGAIHLDLPHEVLDAGVLVWDDQLGKVDVGRVEGESHREAELGVHQKGRL